MLAGASGFDGGIERQQIRLSRDFLDDADLARNLLHRVHGSAHRLTAFFGIGRGFHGDLFCLRGVFGRLFNVRAHLFHRCRHLLNRGCLLAGALAQLLSSMRWRMRWYTAVFPSAKRKDQHRRKQRPV
jgi:hypothetical protein